MEALMKTISRRPLFAFAAIVVACAADSGGPGEPDDRQAAGLLATTTAQAPAGAGYVLMDAFTGANDDAKLTAAMA
jgi:hypothetical protein